LKKENLGFWSKDEAFRQRGVCCVLIPFFVSVKWVSGSKPNLGKENREINCLIILE